MSLELLIQVLCEFGLKRNLVNWASAGPSIYALNPEEIKNYPLLFISPTERIQVGKNTTEYGLTIYYADRLLDDCSNETQIFSMGAETLTNFLRQIENLEGIVEVSDPSIRLFTNSEKMQDRLSGAYTVVTITVLNSANCPIYYDSEGGAIGSFLPAGYGDIKTLVTEQEFLNTIKHYTLTKNFATINGSAITEGGNIVIKGGSGGTDYDEEIAELSAKTETNRQSILTLSGACGIIKSDLSALSAYTETLSGGTGPQGPQGPVGPQGPQGPQGATGEVDYSVLSGYTTTAVTAELSAATSGIAVDLQALSAYTESIVIPDLTDYTTTAVTAELSAATSALSVTVEELAASAVTSSTIVKIWTGTRQEYSGETIQNDVLYFITD